MTGSLHLLKLSVGTHSIEEKEAFVRMRVANGGAPFHITRMVPKRVGELLDGGSLYWVIKGNVQARQAIERIEPFFDDENIRRCRIILSPMVTRTVWQPKRPFQGWRYLTAQDTPRDLNEGEAGLPARLNAELSELGLL